MAIVEVTPDWVRVVVEAAPPLTTEQVTTLRPLLSRGARPNKAAETTKKAA